MYKRVVVTGASGHVGSTICRQLLHNGYTVVGVHRTAGRIPLSLYDIHLHPNFERVLCDICDGDALTRSFAGADAVIHCAAVISINGDNNGEVMRVNVDGVKCMYRCATDQKLQRIIHISSIHAIDYNKHDAIVDEHTGLAIDHHITYNRSKALAQHWLEEMHDNRVFVVNLTGVIGPFDHHNSHTGSMLRNISRKRLPMVLNAGFDWVDVRDIADGIINILEQGKHNRYLLSGHYASIKELSRYVGEVLNIKTVQRSAPICGFTLSYDPPRCHTSLLLMHLVFSLWVCVTVHHIIHTNHTVTFKPIIDHTGHLSHEKPRRPKGAN